MAYPISIAQLPVPALIQDASGHAIEANLAAVSLWAGTGRVGGLPLQERFEADAPNGRRIEWTCSALSSDKHLFIGLDVSRTHNRQMEANRARTTTFATLTHELRTPLNGILGMAGLLGDARLKPAERAWLGAIRESGEHLLGLITDILDYARLDADRIELERIAFDPADIAQSVVELLSPKAHEKGLVVAAAVGADVPTRVWGDDGRIRQILLNLAGNSLKFTDEGGALIRVNASKDQEGKETLCFEVEDTGPGVDADKASLIFEEFGQADSSHARRYGGAGLGLAIVRRLAEAMGGSAKLVDRPGPGALFRVTLPLERAFGPVEVQPDLSGRRALVLTQSPILREALTVTLLGAGFHVEDAEFVPAATSADVVILDHRAAAGDPSAALALGVPVVSVVPQEERASADRYRALGCAQWVVAPVRARSLIERVALALEGGPTAQQMPTMADERELDVVASGLKILVAEDNQINALLVRVLLERAGHRVEVVADGVEALEALSARSFDLVFLDMRMPRLDGPGAARAIRALPGDAAKTPLVALTADAGDEERLQCLAAGMDEFITKPIDRLRLEQIVLQMTSGLRQSA
jgi:signal transduction histidine kinase/CheY-like chemotaxis protein